MATPANRKPRPVKERFDAAVSVIRSLPSEGKGISILPSENCM